MWQAVGRVVGHGKKLKTTNSFRNHWCNLCLPCLPELKGAMNRECFWWFCAPHQTPAWVQTAESGPAHSWYLYYLENRKSIRITSIFFHFSHAFIHSFLTLFLRHFLSTEGQATDYLGATYLMSILSNSEKGQQDKYVCDTSEGHQVSVCLILFVSRYTEKHLQGIYIPFHDRSWGTGSVNYIHFCLYNGFSSPAWASGNMHSLLFFHPYDSHEPEI